MLLIAGLGNPGQGPHCREVLGSQPGLGAAGPDLHNLDRSTQQGGK